MIQWDIVNRKKGRYGVICVVQRVGRCAVTVGGREVSSIGRGMLILAGVHRDDGEKDLDILVRKCAGLRIFPDDDGRMNLSVTDAGGSILVVSQFTLFGDVRRGLRPYFGEAAEPDMANQLYRRFMEKLADKGIPVSGGEFGAHMELDILNYGPVTIILDSRRLA